MARIVVGADGSPGGTAALGWAAEEAGRRHAELVVVTAWQPPMVLDPYAGPAMVGAATDFETLAREHAEASLAQVGLRTDSPGVSLHVVCDAAAPALLDAANGADLLVVGSRGHGGFAGLVLGSVSSKCVSHSACPVVIVPPSQVG